MKIVLDPGHGGLDSGAVGHSLMEKSLAWDISNLIKGKLNGYDVEVIIVQPSCNNPKSTSSDELYLPPKQANKLNADFYLSLHINAGGGTGFESFVHPASKNLEADKVRQVIHKQAMKYLVQYGVGDRGMKYANFAVLRLTNMPAALLECLFIDNPKDTALLKNTKFINGLANEIAYGLALALKLKRR